MEYGLRAFEGLDIPAREALVLILVLMEYGLRETLRVRLDGHYYVLILVLMEYGLRGSNLRRSVYEPFTTKKTAEPENFEGNHVPLSANIQRFFELIVQGVIFTLQFWDFRAFSLLQLTHFLWRTTCEIQW